MFTGEYPPDRGASSAATERLARSKGYRLVATNRFGFNAFFIRGDEGVDLVEAIPVRDAFAHPRQRVLEELVPAAMREWIDDALEQFEEAEREWDTLAPADKDDIIRLSVASLAGVGRFIRRVLEPPRSDAQTPGA